MSRSAAPPATPNRLRQLRAFCQAAQTGSISRAAERLCVSQPSVSLLIKGLEQDLNVLLFERRGPRIELTAAGQVLLETSLPLVEGMDHLPEVFAARLGEAGQGSLDLAAGESTILYLLPEYVKRFSERYPAVKLHLHNVTGRDGLKMLRAGEVDFAVGSMIDVPEDMHYHPIFTYEPMLITALNHPLAKKKKVSLEDVSPCGLILPPRHLSTWSIVDLVFHQHGLDYHVVLEAGGWEVIKKFVELDMGVSIVTSICLTGEEKLAAIPLSDYFPRRTYGVVMRKGKFLSPQACSFLELMDPDFTRCRHADQMRMLGTGRVADMVEQSVDFTGHDRSYP
ncbi:LysR family transcriptional regulator [Thioalkalivibrio sulfidiphilus]|uniref:LysR family transcriptional regulator n=1 Tax=Thioalkalivibrio sulfidiphilus (strain HL-EbGR7) TaxID=396588 RepID=B8GM38_THISH|nr:LysR family transcriptional regulator [Thioalkalivibrio sulfidiphilus]ACL73625.1 LysR family transcriptional regulator [Thioalkalivibrio sulfidiphilus HL-EbGr7]